MRQLLDTLEMSSHISKTGIGKRHFLIPRTLEGLNNLLVNAKVSPLINPLRTRGRFREPIRPYTRQNRVQTYSPNASQLRFYLFCVNIHPLSNDHRGAVLLTTIRVNCIPAPQS